MALIKTRSAAGGVREVGPDNPLAISGPTSITSSPSDPPTGILNVVPSDSVNLPEGVRGLYVGSAGDVAVVMKDGSSGTFVAVPAGTVLAGQIIRVNATGTTALNIRGLL